MLSTSDLVVSAEAAIDLQLHTVNSDGQWTPEGLLEHLAREQFALAAITDHDRPDTAAALQQLALAANVPLLAAAEMSASWRGGVVDVLCFGFALNHPALFEVAQDVARRQRENSRAVYERLCQQGHLAPGQPEALNAVLEAPSAGQPHALAALVQSQVAGISEGAAGDLVWGAGCRFAATDIASVVDAAHRSGAVCVIAHPGRRDGFVCFDADLLDQLRQDVAIDGIEAYYPAHTPEQTAMYLAYAEQHGLLVSAGSDSHGPGKPPIPYPARLCAGLLGRLGVRVA